MILHICFFQSPDSLFALASGKSPFLRRKLFAWRKMNRSGRTNERQWAQITEGIWRLPLVFDHSEHNNWHYVVNHLWLSNIYLPHIWLTKKWITSNNIKTHKITSNSIKWPYLVSCTIGCFNFQPSAYICIYIYI